MEFCIASYPKERRIRTPYIDLSSFPIPFESFSNRGDNNRSGKTNFCSTIRFMECGYNTACFNQLFIHDANCEKGLRDWIVDPFLLRLTYKRPPFLPFASLKRITTPHAFTTCFHDGER